VASAQDRERIDAAEQGSLRLCAVLRVRKPPDELLRFVLDPDGTIVPDLVRRLPGRGVWVTATRRHVEAAVRDKAFARSLKQAVGVPADLGERVEVLMRRRLAEAVSISRKAGLLVTGFAKVEELIDRRRAEALIHAADAAEDGVARLDRKFRALGRSGQLGDRIVRELTGAELSLAIGRPNVIHAAASGGGACERIVDEARRLRRYQEHDGGSAVDVASNTGRA
jgi:predicted RNA-binding protein YlxR (DUF448 family)